MLSIHDQIRRARQARMILQLEMHAALSSKVMDSMQQVADLNLNLARTILEQSNFAARQLMLAKDAHEFLSIATAQIHPNATRILDYGYYLVTITTGAQADVIKAIGNRSADSNRELILLAEYLRESGPFSFKASIACLRSMMDLAACLYAELARIAQKSLLPMNRAGDRQPNRMHTLYEIQVGRYRSQGRHS